MLRCVVNGKAIPQPSARHFAEAIHQLLAGMGAQVVHDQMDGVGGGIVRGDLQDEVGKLGGRARRRYFGEMNARLGLDATKDVGRTAPGRDASNNARSRPPSMYRLPICHTALAESPRLTPTAGVDCP